MSLLHECDGAQEEEAVGDGRKVHSAKVQSGESRKVGKAVRKCWRALYWPDYVVLTVLTTSLSV